MASSFLSIEIVDDVKMKLASRRRLFRGHGKGQKPYWSRAKQAIRQLAAVHDLLESCFPLFRGVRSRRDRLWESHLFLVGYLGGLHYFRGRHAFHLAERSCLHRR